VFKKIISLILVLSFVFAGTLAESSTEMVNLAAGKNVSVSGGTGDGSLLTDGVFGVSQSNMWQFDTAGHYALIDLEQPTAFNTVKIYELSTDGPRLSGYKIEISENNESWETVLESKADYSFTSADGYATYTGTLSFETQTARYVKITFKSIIKKSFIKEIEIYCDPDAVITVPPEEAEDEEEDSSQTVDLRNFAIGKSVTVSRETSGKDHTKVTDGIRNISLNSEAWSVKGGDYIIIDLGEQKTFDAVVVYEYSFIRTKGYTIDVSNDNTTWSNVVPYSDEILSAFGGVTSAKSNAPHYYGKFLFDKTTAQYIKITIDELTEGNWAYIEEIEVYDSNNMPTIEEGEAPVNITLDPPVVVDNVPYESEKFHIYLFMGQSNMSGVGNLLKEDYVVTNGAYLLNSDEKWEIAQPYPKEGSQYKVYQGFNRYSNINFDAKNQTNPALSFTRALRKNIPEDVGIGIICNARGGTYISQWQKGYTSETNDFDLYEKTVERTKAALEKGGVLKGIFWLQGELCASKDGYLEKLNTMVENLRADLGVQAENVPFIASQFVPTKTVQNETISQIATVIENSDYISSEGTASIGDDLHFDAQSQRLLGVRYAEKIMKNVYNTSMTAAQLYDSVYNNSGLSDLSAYVRKQSVLNCYVLNSDVGVTVYSKYNDTVTAPTIAYILNHGMERIGLEDDLSILSDFIKEGYTVVVLDYKNNPDAVSPKLDTSIFEIRKKISDGTVLQDTNLSVETNSLYIVPSGYRLKRNVTYWDYYKHAPNGVLNNIVKSYNEKVVPEFGKAPVTLETILDMERPDGTPVDFSLKMDITYPSKTAKNVPVMMMQSTLTHRNRNEGSTTGGIRYHYIGFLMRGYIYVNYDHSWNPLAQQDHYGYDMFVYGSTMANSVGIATNSAAVRYMKANADVYNVDSNHIGIWGHSKSSQGSLQLSNPHHMEWTERNTAVWSFKDANGETGPREEQPWQGVDSLVAASYQTMGTGTRDFASGAYISDEDAKDQVPTISACGERDEYGAWSYWPDQKARYEKADIPFLAFDMYNLGHTYIHGFDRDYQIDRYNAVFDFFDGYLKPGTAPKVIYTLPYNEQNEILPDESISVKFVPNMAEDTINELSVVRVSDGVEASGTWTVHQKGSLFKWTPAEKMIPGEEYEIRVSENAKSSDNIKMAKAFSSNFHIADITVINSQGDTTVKYGNSGDEINSNFASDDYLTVRNVFSDVEYKNVALEDGVNVTVSNLSPGKQLQRINDGVTEAAGTTASTSDANVLWSTASATPSAKYDLGQEYLVDKIILHTAAFSKNRCSQFRVEKADDADFTVGVEELGTYSNSEGIPDEGAVVEFSEPVSLRYIRFVSLANKTTGYVYFTEFEVYGYIAGESSESANYSNKSYIKFSQDKQFNEATYAELRFTTSVDPDTGKISEKNIDIYGLTDTDDNHLWDEGNLTWNNAPANNILSNGIKETLVYNGEKIGSVTNSNAGEYSIDVTEYIKSLNGKTAVFILTDPDGSFIDSPVTHIISKEGALKSEVANGPQLLVTFEPPVAKITVPVQYDISTKNSEISFTCDNFVIDTSLLNKVEIKEITGNIPVSPTITSITENSGTVTVLMDGLRKGGVYTLDMSNVKSTEDTGRLTVPDITFTTEASISYSVHTYKNVNKTMTADISFKDGSNKYLSKNSPVLIMAKYTNNVLTGVNQKPINSSVWFYDDFNNNGDTPLPSKETGWSGAGSTSVYYNGKLPDGIPGQPSGIKRALVSSGEAGAYRYCNVASENSTSYVEAWFYDDGVLNSSSVETRYGALWVKALDKNGETVNLFAGLREASDSYKFSIGSTSAGKPIARQNGWYKVAFDFTGGNGYRVLINDIQVYPNPDEEGINDGDVDSTYTSFERFSVGSNGWKGIQAPYGLVMASTAVPGTEKYSISLENVEENDTVRLFIWDSLKGLQPVGHLTDQDE